MHLIPAAAAARRLRILPGLADGRPRRLPPEGGPEPPRVQPRGPGGNLQYTCMFWIWLGLYPFIFALTVSVWHSWKGLKLFQWVDLTSRAIHLAQHYDYFWTFRQRIIFHWVTENGSAKVELFHLNYLIATDESTEVNKGAAEGKGLLPPLLALKEDFLVSSDDMALVCRPVSHTIHRSFIIIYHCSRISDN